MTYSVRYTLKNKDVNLHRKLRTSALFELLQEASIAHTEELGMGREMTLDRGFLWVVLQQRADIARMPEYGETITIETWPGATMHVLFPRYYRVKDAHDEVLITGSAVWALLDEQTRRMIFPDRNGIIIEGETTGYEIDLPLPLKRAETDRQYSYTVRFCDCDLNGHMNNTHYFDLCENLLEHPSQGKDPVRIVTEYAQEARYSEDIMVNWMETEDSAVIYGDTKKTCFRMRFDY
ncbi:MAG TPA: hypothetical protein DCG51_05110 [Erysipelotrichaceae bacterium]|nr:hypothetical protein [Erysipelotrichaceae bacterium]